MGIGDDVGRKLRADALAEHNRKEALPLEEKSVEDKYKFLARADFDYQRDVLKPRRELAASRILDPARSNQALQQSMDVSREAVGNSFDRADNRLETAYSRGNQVASARQKKSYNRKSQAARAAAMADAGNKGSEANEDLELDLLVGGS